MSGSLNEVEVEVQFNVSPEEVWTLMGEIVNRFPS